ncbi:MAG: glycosyltransferase family 4 protein [bacterium]
MKLAFIEHPLDHSKLSNPMGVSTFIIQSLRNCGAIVIPIRAEPLPFWVNFYKIKEKVLHLFGIRYKYGRDPKVLSMISESIEDRVNNLDVDGVISFGTLSMAYLDTKKPKFIWTDAVFDNLLDYYSEYKNLPKKTIHNARHTEGKALLEAKGVFFCLNLPMNYAINRYKIYPGKIHFATFGANHFKEHSANEIESIISNKPAEEIRLLFVGYKWEGKGADKTVAIAKEIHNRNIPVRLDIIGFEQRKDISESYIHFHGKLNKLNKEDNQKFSGFMEQATFLMLLSKFEFFGHVVSEANSYGLPAITSNTGGLDEVVVNGKNGMKFENTDEIEGIADSIIATFADREKYDDLCRSSYRESQDRLNWDIGGRVVYDAIEKIVNPDL